MHLLIDTLSDPCTLLLFDEKREIVDTLTWEGKQQEFDTLTDQIDVLLKKNNLDYSGLRGIIVMNGPGGFTGTRVTTLVANTLGFSFHTPLFPLPLSEFFTLQEAPLPWLYPITKREVLLWHDKDRYELKILNELQKASYASNVQIDLANTGSTLLVLRDYEKVVKNLSLEKPEDRIQPIYGKTPNITVKNPS